MRRKNSSVETEFHPVLTAFLFEVDDLYRSWQSEVVITSGSEESSRHGLTSLHYAKPAQAADIRIWEIKRVPTTNIQLDYIRKKADYFCALHDIPYNWIEVILETTHIHIEFQPKRK
jgi:hypothetical protein